MKAFLLLFFPLFLTSSYSSKDYTGKWLMIDESGVKKSIINLYIENDKLYGDIIYLFPKQGRADNPLCTKCEDDRKDKHWVGMQVIRDMKWDHTDFADGTILDPKAGKTYEARFTLYSHDRDKMMVRAYLGPLFRTQNWYRVPKEH